jgi:hypothetical protein
MEDLRVLIKAGPIIHDNIAHEQSYGMKKVWAFLLTVQTGK